METGSRDESASPLDELLAGTPADDPPQDLKERCLRALQAAQKEAVPAGPPRPLRALLATGMGLTLAAFVLVTGILTLSPYRHGDRPMRHEARMSGLRQALEAADRGPQAAKGDRDGDRGDAAMLGAPEAEDSPSPQRVDAELRAGRDVRPQPVTAPGRLSSGLEFVDGARGRVAREYPREDRLEVSKRLAQESERSAPLDRYVTAREMEQLTGGAGAPTKPWRDTSDERQKITRKEMEIEVRDVEDAHGRATSIIESAGGYVETEEVQLGQNDRSQAHLVARVPVTNLNDVVGQLRKLGKVLSLVGESDDRTKEYASRGAAIRELGARECELVEKYEKEKNRYRRQQLYQQIMAIREQNKQAKQPLLELSDKTHLASLDLTMVEAGGPGRFLSNVFGNAGTAALWLAVSAIFWVPALLVITLLWRQIGKRGA